MNTSQTPPPPGFVPTAGHTPQKPRRIWPWFLGLLFGLPLVGFAGCVALLAAASSTIEDDTQAIIDAAEITGCDVTGGDANIADTVFVTVAMESPFDDMREVISIEVTIYDELGTNLATVPVTFENVQPGQRVEGTRLGVGVDAWSCEVTGGAAF